MNIFVTSNNPEQCARDMCDQHVVKMCLEYTQLLSTAHRVLDGDSDNKYKLDDPPEYHGRDQALYKATHVNHPCAIWVRKSIRNYNWLYLLLRYTQREYYRRYKKIHATVNLNDYLIMAPLNIATDMPFSQPPKVVPDQYKDLPLLEAYKAYIRNDKLHFARWTRGVDKPAWIMG